MSKQTLIHVERIIDAPADAVFAVLNDFDRYPEWNGFTERVISGRKIGGPIELHVNMPGGKKRIMRERFNSFVEGKRLSWGLRWGGGILLDCDRVQEVAPLPDGRTRYVTHEEFKGLLARLIVRLYGESVRRGFELCADCLVKRMSTIAPR